MQMVSVKSNVILVMSAVLLSAAGQSGAATESELSPWYIDAGIGMNWTSTLKQEGRNQDMTCYPNDDCSRAGGTPEGYRWIYDLDADVGSSFDASIGRSFSKVQVEFSAAQRKNSVRQEFTDITFLDGSQILPKDSNYEGNSLTSVEDLTSRSVALSAYFDLPLPQNWISAYVGIGIGVTFVELSGLTFESRYSCKDPASDCERPEQYDSSQYVDLSDSVPSKHLYAGVDYPLDNQFLLGLQLSYSLVDDLLDTSSYSAHPVPDLTNDTEIKNMNHWSLKLRLKYRLAK